MKKHNWGITFILIFCLISVFSATKTTESSNSKLSRPLETPQATFSIADSEGPIIGLPSLNNTNPNSDEGVEVTFPIDDIDGVQNATLFWEYTFNNSQYNHTVYNTISDREIRLRNTDFPNPVYIYQTGVESPSITNWVYGEYIFNESCVSVIDITIEGDFRSNLVYVLIQAKNISTGLWQTVHENGADGYTQTLPGNDEDYYSNDLTLGYKISAVTYNSGGDPNPPEFDTLDIWREEVVWDIPAANKATFVDYYVRAFDDLNQSILSPTYTFLMDYTPSVSIMAVPPVLSANDDYILNVSVIDRDGTVNKSSGVAYYQFVGDTNWTAISLNHQYKIPTVPYPTHFFNGTIPASNLGNVETYLIVRVNVSDMVEDKKGREGTSGDRWIRIDSLAPRVSDISIDGGTIIENVTLPTSPVYIEAEFVDARGIKSVFIYYSLPNGTIPIKKEMTNLSFTSPYDSPVWFNVTLPKSNITAFVEYFFETEDFFGNKGNTSVNFYYSDGSGPVLDTLSLYPSVISNYTKVLVLFNSSDYSGTMQSVVWYSFDNQISWIPIGANQINYQANMDSETFTATDLHYIKDNAMSYFPLEVIRSIPVDEAILTFEITHEMPTDLRIWLKLDDGRRFLLYDREPGPNTFTRNIDLTNLGINENDFTKGNFTLEIQDFSDIYSGSILNFEIEIRDYKYPLGYQYYVEIPASVNDTIVFFYINMTDNLWNSENTSLYQYYADGTAPNINMIQLSSPMNLAGKHYIRVSANIIDQGGVFGADAYYKFSEDDYWVIGTMSLNSTSGNYFFDVPISSENGTLFYKVRAFDLAGLSSETAVYSVSYSHGLAPFIEIQGIPYPSPLDMEGKNTIRIWANVTDFDGQVVNCTIGYRFTDADEWKFEDMVYDEETGYYYFDVKVNTKSGNLTFIIVASDNLDLTSESDPYTIEFVNAGTTPGLPTDLLLFGTVLAVGGGGSIAAIVYLSKKGKLKLPERFSRGD
ncbi:MAG: hypothetical protein ACFFB5_04525 [Promethearchaeota archaeon]